jgi:uncharacterized membrane protein
VVILAVSVGAGGWLRFHKIGSYQMTADEAVVWEPAAMNSIGDVFRASLQFDPARLGLWSAVMHFWIAAFGDEVATMRALSAAFGTFDIVLIFLLAQEFFRARADGPGFLPAEESRVVAAISALVFAINLTVITQSRELRDYPFLLAAILLQVLFFVRAAYRSGLLNCAGAGIFALLMAVTNFNTFSLLAVEGLWLVYVLCRHGWSPSEPRSRYAWCLGIALAVAGAVLAFLTPWRLLYLASQETWERPAALSVMYEVLPAVRSLLFPLTVALAGWGAVICWLRARELAALLFLWLLVPVALLAVHLWHPIMLLVVFVGAWFPIFCERWVIASLLPFCLLITLGIWGLRANWARFAAVALVAALALLRIGAYDPATDLQWGTQWAEAAKFVAPYLMRGVPVNVWWRSDDRQPWVEASYSEHVFRYYLRKYPAVRPELVGHNNPDAPLVVISEQAMELCAEDVPKLLAGATLVAHGNRIYVFARARPSARSPG